VAMLNQNCGVLLNVKWIIFKITKIAIGHFDIGGVANGKTVTAFEKSGVGDQKYRVPFNNKWFSSHIINLTIQYFNIGMMSHFNTGSAF
jgi:hypothetical protein